MAVEDTSQNTVWFFSVLGSRKCKYLKDYLLDFEHAWTLVANISSISSSIDMLLMKQGM